MSSPVILRVAASLIGVHRAGALIPIDLLLSPQRIVHGERPMRILYQVGPELGPYSMHIDGNAGNTLPFHVYKGDST